MFRSVLVATRGEIARRVMRTARRNPGALRLDEEYCKTTEFATHIVNSCLTKSGQVASRARDCRLRPSHLQSEE